MPYVDSRLLLSQARSSCGCQHRFVMIVLPPSNSEEESTNQSVEHQSGKESTLGEVPSNGKSTSTSETGRDRYLGMRLRCAAMPNQSHIVRNSYRAIVDRMRVSPKMGTTSASRCSQLHELRNAPTYLDLHHSTYPRLLLASAIHRTTWSLPKS